MRVGPYVRPPQSRYYRVAVLTEDGLLRHEDGGLYHPDELPEDSRAFGQWDVVRLLIRQGVGEALCWNSEEVKWRRTPQPEAEDWKDSRTDVAVHRVPLHPRLRERAFLPQVVAWRDWLASCGARAASSTVGSESMSLLKASLQGRPAIDFSTGSRPPILWTRGGRMEDGPAGQGCFRGRLVQLDLPSAYASLLGTLRYGGLWLEVDVHSSHFDAWLGHESTPMFIRAQVKVPELRTGPLLRFSRRRTNYITMHDLALRAGPFGDHPPNYPAGCYMAGTWTRAELLTALEAGCQVEPQQAWVHRSAREPFAAWWALVQAGREELRGLPGELLVKMTGNALIGNFSRDGGRRSIRGGGRRRIRRLPSGFQPYPAHDLAEYVTGTTRARLYEVIRWAGDRLLTASTDGAWIVDDGTPYPEGWRVKHRAHRLDLLGPTCYRYWRGRWPEVVYAGRPAIEAEERFAEDWAAFLDEQELAA